LSVFLIASIVISCYANTLFSVVSAEEKALMYDSGKPLAPVLRSGAGVALPGKFTQLQCTLNKACAKVSSSRVSPSKGPVKKHLSKAGKKAAKKAARVQKKNRKEGCKESKESNQNKSKKS